MGEVVYINNVKDGDGAHMTGDVMCTSCQNEWTGVVPVGTHELQCPRCHTMHGVFKHQLAPVSPTTWHCNCGNQLFFLLKGEIQCVKCGVMTPLEEIT